MNDAHHIEFIASGRGKAQCQPNPEFPNGKDIDISEAGKAACTVQLPYPAKECGHWRVTCVACGRGIIAITAAGRPDDPKSVRIPCKHRPERTAA